MKTMLESMDPGTGNHSSFPGANRVDASARAALKAALADLIEGRMTNEQFADFNAERCAESPDRAVGAIGEFGDSLYTDGMMAYRLVGRYAVDDETRRTVERCLRFLESDQEYAWPDGPDMAVQCAAGGGALYLLLPFGVVLLIAAGMFSTVSLLLAGLVVLGMSGFLWRWSRNCETPEWQAFWAHGEREAWPFLHGSDEAHIAPLHRHAGASATAAPESPASGHDDMKAVP